MHVYCLVLLHGSLLIYQYEPPEFDLLQLSLSVAADPLV